MATVSASNLFPQSPYLNLMAAGSDGSDGSSPGIHLRWHLLGDLGENHLPKGNLAQQEGYETTIAYNKQQDFVHVYRTEYSQAWAAEVNFATQLTSPDQLKETGTHLEWWFDNLVPVPTLPEEKSRIILRFANAARYNEVREMYNPVDNTIDFLREYNDVLEARTDNQIFFSAEILTGKDPSAPNAYTKVEAIVKEENTPDSLFLIDARKTFFNDAENILLKEDTSALLLEDSTFILLENGAAGAGQVNRLVHENMQYIRFRTFNCYPVGIRIETYHHFLKGVNTQQNGSGSWTHIGDFSLSTDDETVFERLEKPGVYDVHNLWPKFNDTAKVNINNYKAKWLSADGDMPGLKLGVSEYLKASRTDTKAVTSLQTGSDGKLASSTINTWVIGGRKQETEFPLLELLSTVTTDYHVARMLGLGHIDTGLSADKTKKYIHLATYETGVVENVFSAGYTHSYMTLGTSMLDFKLPKTPEISLDFGLYTTDINDEKTLITDEEGYFPGSEMRAINIEVTNHIPVADSWQTAPAFFVPDADFDNSHTLAAVCYGIEYKRTEEPAWRTPEISHDKDFFDTEGKGESIPLLWPDETKPLYTHFEREEGSHEYGAYSINWFSRASPVSNTRTAETTFPKSYSLLPPFNFSALLIQEEEPDALFVTTLKEQEKLRNAPVEDKSLVRVMFNWDDLQNRNYFPCNQVVFVFREPMLKSRKGQIKSAEVKKVMLQGKNRQVVEIRTRPFTRFSVSPPEVISPALNFGTNEHLPFIGGAFNVEGVPYLIRDILPSSVSGEGPVFLLEAVKKRVIVQGPDANDYGNLGAKDHYDVPPVDALFTVFENLADQANWTSTLQKKIDIVQWSSYKEKVIESGSGEEKEFVMGGITERVTVSEISVKDPETAVLSDRTGIYKMEFATNPLSEHPQGAATVEWYSGVVRVSLENPGTESLTGEIRRLDVIGIDTTASPGKLILYVIDNQFATQGHNLDYTAIPEGPNVLVNFHPGYRVYLYAEEGFNKSTLYNFGNAETHDSYIAAYSVDSLKGLSSFVCPPSRLRAQKIHKPVKPEPPIGPEFATKPNFYGKSTYSFETPFDAKENRRPYSLQFCRGNDMAILQTLYKTDTVNNILLQLASLPDDTYYFSRLRDLADGVAEPEGEFKIYGEGPNAYQYPIPDNPDYIVPYTNYLHPVSGVALPPVTPFAGGNINPGSTEFVVSNTADYPYKPADEWRMVNIVKEAILSSFLPLTEMPVIYTSIKKAPYEPKNIKPVLRDRSGNLLQVTDPSFDPAPMAVITEENATAVKVRFVDFTLDGASNRLHFYFAREMSNNLALGPVSDVLGPIQLINTSPASAPQIEKVISVVAEPVSGEQTSVVFEITNYLEAEKINKFKIYRTTRATEATSTRTMKLATTVSAGDLLADYFEDQDFVPFGEVLYYRLVAIREVKMPDGSVEEIESLPSNMAVTNLVDAENPDAPEIRAVIGTQTAIEFQNVTLEWDRTSYNATYYLYKMTPSGNWTRIHSIKSNDSQISYTLPENLVIRNEEEEPVYHRYKVTVENSSGLLNLEEKEITLPVNN